MLSRLLKLEYTKFYPTFLFVQDETYITKLEERKTEVTDNKDLTRISALRQKFDIEPEKTAR